jgi:sugar lactone lactonase YvrE
VRRHTAVELLLDAHAELGEGPVWDHTRGELLWVDVLRGQAHRLDIDSGRDKAIDLGQPVGAIGLCASGNLVAAVRDGFGIIDKAGKFSLIAAVESEDPMNRMNDGKCDSRGRFWAGTMAFDAKPGVGALYRLEPDHSFVKALAGVTISNGLSWSPDDRIMYFIDSAARGIDAFDFDRETGRITKRRRVINILGPTDSVPDGMTVDAEGYIWVAVCFGSAVHRYSPTGQLDTVIELPISQATSCCFGRKDLGDLYITSAALNLKPEQLAREPHAGGIFVCRPGVIGQPSQLYGG